MISNSKEETNSGFEIEYSFQSINDLAECFVSYLPSRFIVALHGELGSGKTTFVRACSEALQINNQVSSPSYVLENQYVSPDLGILVRHWDLYRVQDDFEILQEIITFSNQVRKEIVFVEWAEKITGLENKVDLSLVFKAPFSDLLDEGRRLLHLKGSLAANESFREALELSAKYSFNYD